MNPTSMSAQRYETLTRVVLLSVCFVPRRCVFLPLLFVALACGNDTSESPVDPTSTEGAAGAQPDEAERGGGPNAAEGGNGGEGLPGNGGTSGNEEEAVDPCVAPCQRYVEQCGVEDDCSILCLVWRRSFVECEPEFDENYACVDQQADFEFDCSQDFLLADVDACTVELETLWYCDRAEGLECRHEPALDESCSVGTPKPPNYTYCRYDATPPEGCVPHLGELGDTPPLGWCCPAE
jgi:hypothetical protein